MPMAGRDVVPQLERLEVPMRERRRSKPKRFPTLLAASLAIGAAGCVSLDFPYSHESDEYVVSGQLTEEGAKADFAGGAQVVELTSGFTDLTLELQMDGVLDHLDDLALTGFSMERTITSEDEAGGDRDDLSFIERVDLYVIGRDGLPSFLMGSYDRDRDGYALDSLPLTMHEELGLRLYIEKGLEMYVMIRGSIPEDDVSFRIESDFQAYFTP